MTLLTEAQQRAWDAVNEHGGIRAASRALDIPYGTIRNAYDIAKRKMELDPAISGRLTELGLSDLGGVRNAWVELRDKDGKKAGNVFVGMSKVQDDISDKIAEATESALQRISISTPAAPTLIRPKATDGALYGFLPLFDAHIGLQMPGYGLDDAVARLVGAAFEAINAMPAAGCIAIINGGDFTHQNDNSNQTPAHKHPLPISANYLDTSDAATDARIAIIEYAARKFDRVETKDIIGNHDPNTAKIIRAALRQRYRDHDRITVDLDGVNHWHKVFGANLLSVHHGDIKRALKDMALALGQKYRAERGVTKVHEHHTGHLHHIKETRIDIGGIMLCQHAAISPKSNYDNDNMYESASILQAITYRESGGRKSTIEVSIE